MDEFGAKLDRDRRVSIVEREDASADALARFKDDDIDARLIQATSRSEAGGTRTDDDDVCSARGRAHDDARDAGRAAANFA